jgi:hypothetical protein
MFSLLFMFSGCSSKDTKTDIFNLVEKKYDAILKACEDKDEDALLSIKGITKVNIIDGYVIVFCEGKGISVSSKDYGFYFSVENIPITVDCNQDIVCENNGLTPEGNGYQCVVQGNTFYTEHIKGNIYFYSNAY